MSKCFDHKTTFLDTHRDFRLAIDISIKCSHRFRGVRSSKNQRKNKLDWIFRLYFELVDFLRLWNPYVKKARVVQCTTQNWDCIRIVHSITLAFLRTGYTNKYFQFSKSCWKCEKQVFNIFIYTECCTESDRDTQNNNL